ncbi:guanine nucleotide binding protein, alpha subunit [Phlebopus sp. FC_14]|nr:guanine nucleotide binding protein, alpha subunit [Phlebopus sp. FC_14]
MVRLSLDDPFASILAPPPNETPDEKEAREQAEAEARRISDAIDEQIRQERNALKKKKKPVKVLLLGQSESGKSATLKNFQLHHACREWAEQRGCWRAVIYLNLTRNVIHLLDLLVREMSPSDSRRPGTAASTFSDSEGEAATHSPVYRFTDKHRLLKLRLAPLRRVKADLEKKLGPGSREIYSTAANSAMPIDSAEHPPCEIGIHSTNGWKSVLDKLRPAQKDDSRPDHSHKRKEEENEVTDVLVGCKEDMKSIWEDPVVQQILAHRRAKIEECAGFFLNDIERIASYDYEPSDNDIVRARLRTVGVQEHRFVMEEGNGREWMMYDFGGTRSSRATWASYFDDVDTIIFLSPISCFDERLREDRRINRLEDSFQLWRAVCSSRILAKTQIILFLNKCDLLHNKIQRGILVRDYIPSFGDRKNDSLTVMKYFQQHFKEISKVCSPERRPFFVHFTSVIVSSTPEDLGNCVVRASNPHTPCRFQDTKATEATLSVVKESILRTHLKSADLL